MVSLGSVDELKNNSIQCIEIGEKQFALFYLLDEFYLLDNLCPHKAAALCDGDIYGNEVECPWHRARFDIKTGRGLSPLAGIGVKSWPVSITDGQLMADLS